MNTIFIDIEESNSSDFFDITCTTDHGFYVLLMLGIIESWKECFLCRYCCPNIKLHNQTLINAKKFAGLFDLQRNFDQFQNMYTEIHNLDIKEKIFEISSKNYYNNLSLGIRCILASLIPKLSYPILSGTVVYPNSMKENFLSVLSAELNLAFKIVNSMDEENFIERCRMVCPVINFVKKDNRYCLRYYNQAHSHFDKAFILQEIVDSLSA